MDHYSTLGVAKNATTDDIKKAYRRMAGIHHPDKGGDENRFKEIANAYGVLGDEGKRKQYDQQKNNPFPGFNGGGGGPSMDDIFAQFFGGQMPNQKRQRQTPEKLIAKRYALIVKNADEEKYFNIILNSGLFITISLKKYNNKSIFIYLSCISSIIIQL